jgi:methylthioribose-1-phosphate isomerase
MIAEPGAMAQRDDARRPADAATIRWNGGPDGQLELLDQTRLPGECVVLRVSDLEGVRDAIGRLAVRGAPAIGVAAGYGLWLGIRGAPEEPAAFEAALERAKARLVSARPTAANLAWAVGKVAEAALGKAAVRDRKAAAFEAAKALHADDVDRCARIGAHGAALLRPGERVLTYCNTGALATAGSGTALAIVFEAKRRGMNVSVVSCETRPLLQGARLTMWELLRQGIPATLITDNAAATVMRQKKVDRVLVGADRIARNGDTANKIGTYGLALLAKAHGVPFYVAAPRSTFDPTLANGDQIPIEERDASEITEIGGVRIAPAGARVFAPAFDVTPASLIAGIVTEAGVISPVDETRIANLLRA